MNITPINANLYKRALLAKDEGWTDDPGCSSLLCAFADEGEPRVFAWTTVGRYIVEASPSAILNLYEHITQLEAEIRTLKHVMTTNESP